MATKKIKKTTSKKNIKKKSLSKDNIQTKNEESASLSVMIIAIIGVILLIYFGTSSSISVSVDVESNGTDVEVVENEIIDESVIISGKRYLNKEEAYKSLRFIPQSVLQEDEIQFVESYK